MSDENKSCEIEAMVQEYQSVWKAGYTPGRGKIVPRNVNN